MDTSREQQLLRLSIGVTLLVGLAGIAFGLWIRSQSIVSTASIRWSTSS